MSPASPNDKNEVFEFLQDLFDFAGGDPNEIDTMPVEQLREEIRREGIDPDSFLKSVRSRVGDLIGQAKRATARDRLSFLREALEAKRTGQLRLPTFQEILERFASSMDPVYCRRFQEAQTDQEREQILRDLLALEELEDDEQTT